MLQSSLAIYRYELKKSFSLGTTFLWICVIVFPTILQLLINIIGSSLPDEFTGVLMVGMIPGAVCLMTILSSMAPYLNTELEGNTWPYVAVRPHGRTALMLGKYFVSVTRSIIAGLLAIAIVMPTLNLNESSSHVPLAIAKPVVNAQSLAKSELQDVTPNGDVNDLPTDLSQDTALPLWLALSMMVVLSSFSYSTLFCLLGTIMHKKPMILAIIYTLLVEGVISMLPAVVNAFTINFYLRSIFLRAMNWNLTDLPDALSFINDPNMFSQATTIWDLISLTVLSGIFLMTANSLLLNREYHVGETL